MLTKVRCTACEDSVDFPVGKRYDSVVNGLADYCKEALARAVVKKLGSSEGYSAKIPGFAGLVVFGATRPEVINELKSALEGWVELSLQRGDGLLSFHSSQEAIAALSTPPCGFGIGSFIAPFAMN